MNITFCCTGIAPQPWLQGLQAALPGAAISLWQPGAPCADYAVVWAPPQPLLDGQRGLKALFNIGAGVDALLKLRHLNDYEGDPVSQARALLAHMQQFLKTQFPDLLLAPKK